MVETDIVLLVDTDSEELCEVVEEVELVGSADAVVVVVLIEVGLTLITEYAVVVIMLVEGIAVVVTMSVSVVSEPLMTWVAVIWRVISSVSMTVFVAGVAVCMIVSIMVVGFEIAIVEPPSTGTTE